MYTLEIAEALGIRDRIMGVDAEARGITLARFRGIRGRKRLERAYRGGWLEAESYCGNCWDWGAISRRGRACDATRMQHASKRPLKPVA